LPALSYFALIVDEPAGNGSALSMGADQRLHSPVRRGAKQCDEDDSAQAPCQIVFAPTLEHGDHSNHEQEDCDRSASFNPHVSSPPAD